MSLVSSALAGRFCTTATPERPHMYMVIIRKRKGCSFPQMVLEQLYDQNDQKISLALVSDLIQKLTKKIIALNMRAKSTKLLEANIENLLDLRFHKDFLNTTQKLQIEEINQ